MIGAGTLAELSAALQSKQLSSRELTESYLARCRQLNPEYNCLITLAEETALEQAQHADQLRARGETRPLIGIPLIHKDIYCSGRTTCGSKMLADFVAPYEATVVRRLSAAGMVSLGKANMDEFAMGSSNETSYFGPVLNPWDRTRVPGGSSGGSAAAVACGMAPVATGTDTGGSIRQPAALCGITGIKPTYGRVSRYGMIAFASSLDQGGALGKDARDLALVLNAMCGDDPLDSTCLEREAEDFSAKLEAPLDGLRIGIPGEYFLKELDGRVRECTMAALQVYERLGARQASVSLAQTQLALPAYQVISSAECSSNLARYDGVRYGYRCHNPGNAATLYRKSRTEGFGREVKRRIMLGTFVLSAGYHDAYYVKAQQVRARILEDFRQVFKQVDLVLTPATPEPAFKLGERLHDPVSMYLSDVYTVPVNLAGLPAITLPAGFIEGLPVGMQLIGPHFSEALLLNVAHRYQQETDWHLRSPPRPGS